MATEQSYYAAAPGRTEEARVRNAEWAFECAWAEGLTTQELRTITKLKTPGGAGLAAQQELGRRKGRA